MPFDSTHDEAWEMIHLRGEGKSLRQIEAEFDGKLPHMKIRRTINYYSKYGGIPAFRQHKRAKYYDDRLLSDCAKGHLREIVEDDPSLYLDEMADKLNEFFEMTNTHYAVDKALREDGFTLKELQHRAMLQDAAERAAYLEELANYPPHTLIYVDEMSTTNRTKRRRRGRARRGRVPFMK